MTQRLRIRLRGAVQGIGFRPFVHRLAHDLKLAGWVCNSPQGVVVEVEGADAALDAFLVRLDTDRPPFAAILERQVTRIAACNVPGFEIRPSEANGAASAVVLPDLATCSACRREIFTAGDRRHLYPFTNCTGCGPRWSILERLPYDRPNTSMREFEMCAACAAEYHDPNDRRFHAQPNACPACGPRLELRDATGRKLAGEHAALQAAARALRAGRIVAVQGLGGFHLLVDGRDADAVRRLRARKHREAKPLAVMFPDQESVTRVCAVSPLEAQLLSSIEAPIVLLRRLPANAAAAAVAATVAPRNPNLGVLLPYSPLHHLLLHELGFPVVATSGNRSEEPLCIDAHEALRRLGGIADFFLVHDRRIVRAVDDSVVRVLLGQPQVLRRARGYAPLPMHRRAAEPPLLAVGGHLKNTVAIAVGHEVFVSPHVGDLEHPATRAAFHAALTGLRGLYDVDPSHVVADAHPDYVSTQTARGLGLPVLTVQHHHAHVAACMAEHDLEPPLLGVAWDGTGAGLDGTVWGGEFLRLTADGFERLACLRPFGLPGGEMAVREPRRVALGVLYELWGEDVAWRDDLPPLAAFTPGERRILVHMLQNGVHAPRTSSAGRLFDAVAALVGLRQRSQFEAQAAMELEFAADSSSDPEPYAFDLIDAPVAVRDPQAQARWWVDWEPALRAVVADVKAAVPAATIAARFQAMLVEAIVAVAGRAAENRVLLTGGCFQNAWLTTHAVRRLREAGFSPEWSRRVPTNDGGIAVGQIAAATRALHPGDVSCV